jgi:hypothetical protein
MTALLLALSLSNSFTKVGAIVAFAAIVGIALLAMLFFAQARELKRLREWSEEEPRRMAELEQRLSSALALRIQRATAQVARPVAVKAVSAVAPATRVAQGEPEPPMQAPESEGEAAANRAPVVKLLPAAPAIIAGNAVPAGAVEAAEEPESLLAEPALDAAPVVGLPADAEPTVTAASSSEPASGEDESRGDVGEEIPALAAVAAEASSLTASASPASASPVAPEAPALRPAVPAPRAPSPPPSSGSNDRPRRSVSVPPEAPEHPRRITGRPTTGAPPRRAAPPLSNGRSQPARRPVTRRGGPPPGPPFLREERSPARGRLLIAGGVIVVVVLLIVLLTSGGGSSNKGASSTGAAPATLSPSSGETTAATTHHSESSLPASNPAETHVVVLNGTETGGLAHRLSGNLQQSGYTLATALNGHPSGRSTTVIEYAPGHRADARHVAQTLGVSQTQPLESSIAAMDGGSATVVVVAGSDLAGAGSAGAGSGETPASTGEAAGGTGQ